MVSRLLAVLSCLHVAAGCANAEPASGVGQTHPAVEVATTEPPVEPPSSPPADPGVRDPQPDPSPEDWHAIGQERAQADLEEDRLRLQGGRGYPSRSGRAYARLLSEHGIVYSYGGCVVGPNEEGLRLADEGYNQVMEEEIARRHGPRFLERLLERARTDPDATSSDGDAGNALVMTPGGWANVYLADGRHLGQTPLRIQLPVGRHHLRLRPFGEPPDRRVAVEVTSTRVARVVVPLQEQADSF